MVTRVSTTGNYASILSNLMSAQLRQFDANERVSSQKNGNDLEKTIAGWDQVVAHAKDAAKGNPDEGGAQ